MNQPQFLITRVAARAPARLLLSFADGFSGEADLSGVVARHPTLARLNEPGVFAQVAVDEWSRGVVFAADDELALASDNLRALILEQAGEFSHQQIIAWMARHRLSLSTAAEALGLSRRMLAYYRSGEKAIPKTVGLALLGWEVQQSRTAA
ncbi:MAG: hypothetical protein WCY72_08375 [Lysobacteraceae bacterium]